MVCLGENFRGITKFANTETRQMRRAYIKGRPHTEVGRFRFMVAAEENRAMVNNLSPFISSNEELGVIAFKQIHCQGGVSHHFSNSLKPSRGNFVVPR